MTDVEIATRATTILRSRGRRDRFRASQVATYRRVLDRDGEPGFIAELPEKDVWMSHARLAAAGATATRSTRSSSPGPARDFRVKSHIWIKGFLAT